MNTQPRERFPIIDGLRFVLASWVAMGHFGVFPLFAWVNENTNVGRVLVHGWSSTIWGPPAVVGFFVISGFCIHLPYRHQETLRIGPYYTRRYIRILIPACAFLILSMPAPILGPGSILWNSVLWSLFCEEIYYAFYPLVRVISRRYGWMGLLSGAWVTGASGAVVFRNALDGTFFGTIEIAIILYPVWLMGAFIAEQVDRLPAAVSRYEVWRWRLLAWLGSWACEMAHFKAKLPLGLALLCFGALAFLWIRKEVESGANANPWGFLAAGGLWSYSLYLVHRPAAFLFFSLRLHSFGPVLNWCLLYGFIGVLSYLFYLCIEKPAHKLARKLSSGKARLQPAQTAEG